MKITLFNILILSIFCFSSCKRHEVEKEKLNELAQNYLADYNELIDTLTTYHPALYEFTSKADFNNIVEQIRNEIDNTTTKENFIWKLSKVMAIVDCGHTSLGFFNQQRDLLKPKDYFPLLTRLINNKLYVIDNLTNKDNVQIGQEISQINGKPINEIISIIYSHINSQADIESSKRRLFNGYNTSMIPYALNFPDVYNIKIAGESGIIRLKSLNKNPPYTPLFSEKHPCQSDFCLTEVNAETVLLTLRNFAYYGDKTKIFLNFLNDSFNEIKTEGFRNLIIDVRENLGGPGEASINLLKYTLHEPFQYFANSDYGRKEVQQPFENNFKGKIIFVMNGNGYSTVGHLASIYKDKNRVVFVGEALGSNQFCTANQKQFELTNTKFTYTVARNIFITDVQEKDPKATIEPDIEIEQSIDDFLSDKDVVLEKAIELTEK
ncbi:S41 family peptidase [Xanthomarina sp. GH4-25]|uniref:S41 family peptidase n=1 Tax=Xanthomarina sp. GH4-25 TaxID=3349335 RepID=UPI0038779412